MKLFYACFFVAIIAASCNTNQSPNNTTEDNNNPAPPLIGYSILKVYPHDTSSYTEGLELHDTVLYESGGNYGASKLVQKGLDGNIIKKIPIDKKYFGEGITVLNNKIYQLTWQEHAVFVYDAATLKKIKEFEWPYEGWGMTNDGKNLIISTGSSILYFIDPETFQILNQVSVTNNYGPVTNVNELEWVNNFIYANVYETNDIIKIDPQTGAVVGKIDLSGLLQKSGMSFDADKYNERSGNVLNGIAFNAANNSLLVTGKMWPAMFEIKLNN